MAKSGNLTIIADESLDNKCTVCERQGKITKSGVFCFECQTYLCADCVSTHNIFCIGHHVLKTTDEKVQNILTERCQKHPDKVIEFYCRNHDEVVCTTCYFLNHKKCDDVKHISESVAELSADPDIQAIPGQIDAAFDHVNQIIETFGMHIKHIEREKDKFLEDLEEFAKSILSKIEEMRKRGKDDITALHQRITSKANEKLDACVQAKEDLSKTSEEIKLSSKRNAHLIVLKNQSKKKTKQTETLCNESKQMIKETEFCFRRNNKIADVLAGFNSLLEESNVPMEQLELTETDSDIEDPFFQLQKGFAYPQEWDERPSSRRQTDECRWKPKEYVSSRDPNQADMDEFVENSPEEISPARRSEIRTYQPIGPPPPVENSPEEISPAPIGPPPPRRSEIRTYQPFVPPPPSYMRFSKRK